MSCFWLSSGAPMPDSGKASVIPASAAIKNLFMTSPSWLRNGAVGAELGEKSRNAILVLAVRVAELLEHLGLLAPGEARVHEHKDRIHRQRDDGRPLHEKAGHDQHEAQVLGMPKPRVRTGSGEPVRALRLVEMLPRCGEQPESRADQHEAEEMKRPEMGIRFPAEHHLEQMPGVMRKEIDSGKLAAEPPGEQVDGQRIAVHLREQRHQKSRERAEGAPVA